MAPTLTKHGLEAGRHPAQVRTALWALLADGVFAVRPRTQRKATALLGDDLSVRLLTHALNVDSDFTILAPDRGAVDLADALLEGAAAAPNSPLAVDRVQFAVRMVQDRERFDGWWQPHMTNAIGTADEVSWLRLGVPLKAAERLPTDVGSRLHLDGIDAAQVALNAGVSPPAGSNLEERLVRAVLDGLCSETMSPPLGLAGDLLRLLAPQHFIRKARDTDAAYVFNVGHADAAETVDHRQAVLRRLKSRASKFGTVQAALRFSKGQSGTTSPWGNTARALCEMLGPSWLAAEIAVIGAAISDTLWRTGGDITPGSQPFGPHPDYGRLLEDIRLNRFRTAWWHIQFDTYDDPLSRGTWTLAMLAIAHEQVIRDSLDQLNTAIRSLPEPMATALVMSSSRLAASGLRRRLSADLLPQVVSASPTVALLIAHYVGDPRQQSDLAPLGVEQLGKMGQFGVAAWPATRALTTRMLTTPTTELVDALRLHAVAAIVNVENADRVPLDLLNLIVDQPRHYPLPWLLAAERRISRAATEPPLATVADSDHWFGE